MPNDGEGALSESTIRAALQGAPSKSVFCDGSTVAHVVTKVDLTGRRLKEVDTLGVFVHLQDVCLADNEITTLRALSSLRQMRRLNVARNRLDTFLAFDVPVAAEGVADECDYPRLLLDVNVADNRIETIGEGVAARFPYLAHIEITGNHLTHLRDLAGLQCLAVLNAGDNEITSLEGIEDLPIVELDVHNNRLRAFATTPLPRLRYLNVSGNMIDTVNGIACQPNVAVLHVRANRIADMHSIADLVDLELLRDLDLSGNPIRLGTGDYRRNVLFMLPDLELLDNSKVLAQDLLDTEIAHDVHKQVLAGINIRFLPEGAQTTPAKLAEHQRRSRIQPSDDVPDSNAFDFWMGCAEAGFLSPWEPFLQASRLSATNGAALSLADLSAGAVGLYVLANAMSENSSIVDLHLDRTLQKRRWTSLGAATFLLDTLLQTPPCLARLRTLNMAECYLSNLDASALATFVRASSAIRVLGLRGNHLAQDLMEHHTSTGQEVAIASSPGFAALLDAAAACPTLQRIDLAANGICNERAAHAIAHFLQHSRSIDHVDLSENAFGAAGARVIFRALQDAPHVSSVVLRRCAISPKTLDQAAIQFLGQSIARSTCLRAIDLSCNALLDEGIVSLLTAAPGHASASLRELNLARCQIGSPGMAALASWARLMPAIVRLDVSGNSGTSSPTMVDLVDAIGADIIDMCLSGTTIDDAAIESVGRAMATRPIARCCVGRDEPLADGTPPASYALLTSSVGGNGALRAIDLANHDLSAAATLIDAIAAHPGLQSANLFNCNLSGAQVSVLLGARLGRLNLGGGRTAWGAVDNVPGALSHLRCLDLTSSALLDGGTRTLARALQSTSSLEQLCLDHALLGNDDSVRQLLDALGRTSINALVLSSCHLNENNFEDLVSLAPAMVHLAALDLADNLTDEQTMLLIAAYIERNPPALRRVRLPALTTFALRQTDIPTNVTALFWHIFGSSLARNTFLCELNASEIGSTILLDPENRKQTEAMLQTQKGSRLSRLVFGNGRPPCIEANEAADVQENRSAAHLANNRIRSGDLIVEPWALLGRCGGADAL